MHVLDAVVVRNSFLVAAELLAREKQTHAGAADRIDFILDSGDEVRVVPVTASVKQLKGMVPKPRKPVTLEQMDDAIARAYGRSR